MIVFGCLIDRQKTLSYLLIKSCVMYWQDSQTQKIESFFLSENKELRDKLKQMENQDSTNVVLANVLSLMIC